MPSLTQFLKSLNETRTLYENANTETVEGLEQSKINEYKYTTAVKAIVNNYTKGLKFNDKLDSFITFAGKDVTVGVLSSFLDMARRSLAETPAKDLYDYIVELNKKLVPRDSNEVVNASTYFDYIKDKYNHLNDETKEIVNNAIQNIYSISISNLLIKKDIENANKYLKKGLTEVLEKQSSYSNTKIDEEDLVPEESEYTYITEKENGGDLYLHTEAIKSMLDYQNGIPEPDEELISALKDAKNILMKGDPNTNDELSKLAEDEGVVIDHIKMADIKENIKENHKNINIQDISGQKRHLGFNANLDKNVVKDYLKELTKNEVKFSKSFKDDVKSIINEMVESGIQNKGDYISETGDKLYSFSLLVNLKNDLGKAIESQDRDKIILLTTEYRELEKKYDSILDKIAKVKPEADMASNLSSSRNTAVPFKYRKNYVNASRLNALYLAESFLRENGKTLDEFLDKPVETINVMIKDRLNKNSEIINEVKNGDIVKIVETFSNIQKDLDFKAKFVKDDHFFNGLERFADAFSTLCPDKKASVALKEQYMFLHDIVIQSNHTAVTNINYEMRINPVNFIKNLCVAQGENNNPFKLTSEYKNTLDPFTLENYKEFDRAKEIKNGDITVALANMSKLNNKVGKFKQANNDNVRNALTDLCAEITEAKLELSSNSERILNNISKNKDVPKEMYQNAVCEHLLNDIKNGVNKDNIEETLNKYSIVKSSYNKRWGLAKLFYKDLRNQSAILSSLEEKIYATGISKKELKDLVKARKTKNKDNLFNDKFAELKNKVEVEATVDTRVSLKDELSKVFDEPKVEINNIEIKLDPNLTKEPVKKEELEIQDPLKTNK